MYYYGHQKDIRPKGVIFLTGCLVDRVHDKEMEGKGYWGIELLHQDLCTGEHHRHDKRVLFCKSEEEREDWVTLLQHNAQVVPPHCNIITLISLLSIGLLHIMRM